MLQHDFGLLVIDCKAKQSRRIRKNSYRSKRHWLPTALIAVMVAIGFFIASVIH